MDTVIEASWMLWSSRIVAILTFRRLVVDIINSGIYGAKCSILGLITIDHALRFSLALFNILVQKNEFCHVRVWLSQVERRRLASFFVAAAKTPLLFGIKYVILWCVEVARILGYATAFCN